MKLKMHFNNRKPAVYVDLDIPDNALRYEKTEGNCINVRIAKKMPTKVILQEMREAKMIAPDDEVIHTSAAIRIVCNVRGTYIYYLFRYTIRQAIIDDDLNVWFRDIDKVQKIVIEANRDEIIQLVDPFAHLFPADCLAVHNEWKDPTLAYFQKSFFSKDEQKKFAQILAAYAL